MNRQTNQLLLKIKDMGGMLYLEGTELKLSLEKGKLDPQTAQEIRKHKEELILFLKSEPGESKFEEIGKTEKADNYPVSSAQNRFWAMSQLEAGNVAYNMPGAFVFEGKLDKNALNSAFQMVIDRHEILRTVFREDETGIIRQWISDPGSQEYEIGFEDLSDTVQTDKTLKNKINADFGRPFDLSSGPLLRTNLYQLTDRKWVFSFVMHHIVSDGWSLDILLRDLSILYNSNLGSGSLELQPLRIQYKDYVIWKQKQVRSQELAAHKAYWINQFAGKLPVLELPADHIRPAEKSFRGKEISRMFGAELNQGLKVFCQEQGGTLFMGLLAVVKTLLYRYTNQEDIIIGSPIADREHSDLDEQIGPYLNTLALRTRFSGKDNFIQLFSKVKQVTLDSFEHQSYPFDEIINTLNIPLDASRSLLFDVWLVLQNTDLNAPKEKLKLEGIQFDNFHFEEDSFSKFDLVFSCEEKQQELNVSITYNCDIYTEDRIKRMLDHLECILKQVLSAPYCPLDEIKYLSPLEEKTLLKGFNNTLISLDDKKTVLDLFREQVVQTPDQVAVVFENRRLTYRELDELTCRFAYYLQTQYGLESADFAGIKQQRSEWLLVSMISVLKCGAAYIPIDPEYPEERIAYMIKDSQCKVVIDETVIDEFQKIEERSQVPHNAIVIKPSDALYVIYTSGTTGKPKGVVVEHRNLVNYITWLRVKFELESFRGTALLSSMSWDGVLTGLYGALLSGGTVHIVGKNILHKPEELSRYLIEEQVDFLKITPPMLGLLLSVEQELCVFSKPDMRLLFVGGEKIKAEDIKSIYRMNPAITIVNHYGPTETTIGVTTETILANFSEDIPIGKPIGNTRIYILDGNLELVPVGNPGEICISGDNVARGYLNKPDLTAEKFIPNPYEPGRKMYKTGDRGYWRKDGKIAYIGRKDSQVKIRGYRIELSELELIAKQFAGMQNVAALVTLDESGDNGLALYAVSESSQNKEELMTYLRSKLPSYMLPDHVVFLNQLPMDANGKLDKKALLAWNEKEAQVKTSVMTPRNAVEAKLQELWCDVLGKEQVGIQDNFFEFGGQSLKAIRLYTRIAREFDVKLELSIFFNQTTIEDQAKLVQKAKHSVYEQIKPVPHSDSYVLSSSQRRMWVLSQFEEGNIAYNMPLATVFEGKLDMNVLERAARTVIERHEILRTVFRENEQQEIRQYILSASELNFKIEYHDLREDVDQKQKLKVMLADAFDKPFDIRTGPLIRATLFRTGETTHVFVSNLHHLISDGWSMVLLINEALTLYTALKNGGQNPLPELGIQYKDYAVWQQHLLNGEQFKRHRTYWLDQFSGTLPVLSLAGERARPVLRSYRGGIVKSVIPAKLNEAFKQFCQQQGGTLFMGVLSILNTLLYKYSNQDDIIVGSPIAGREQVELENQMGVYLNVLALRTRFSEDDSFKELFQKVKKVTLDGYEHQMFPFDELIDELPVTKDLSRNPLYDVMLVGQDDAINIESLIDSSELRVSDYTDHDFAYTKLDLRFQYVEQGDELIGTIEYSTDIFSAEFAERLSCHFYNLLEEVVRNPETPLVKLNCLSDQERNEILHDFNPRTSVYEKEKTVLQLFEEQLERTPESTAISDGILSLTYRELNELAEQAASCIVRYTQTEDQYVAIHQERTVHTIVSIYAILKAGKAYLPIEPSVPVERKKAIFESVKCSVILADASNFNHSKSIADSEMKVLQIEEIEQGNSGRQRVEMCKATDVAYIIFTSGSTGVPKGVIVQHRPVVNLIEWVCKQYQLEKRDRLLCTASISFDLSVFDVFGILSTGGCVRIATNEELKDPSSLAQILYDEPITFWDSAPVLLQQLVPYFTKGETHTPTLRLVFLSGDWIPLTLPGSMKQAFPKVQVVALGGATEATVWSNYFEVNDIHPDWRSIPYGKPIQNAKYYVLNKALQPVPIGVRGDLYIGGEVLAMGYNDPVLSSKKFIPNPFENGERIYHTGDKAAYFADGNIEFLGREDDQVKIRGYRIELGDIESALLSLNGIDAAVVVAHGEQKGDKSLVAYLVSQTELNMTDIRSYLATRLPAYMLPMYYVQLETLPLTANGKLNKKALPDPANIGLVCEAIYVAPKNEIERKLVTLWSDILKREDTQIGTQSNFFEMGGHSVKAMQLISRMNKEFEVTLKPITLFGNPTIEGVASEIEKVRLVNSVPTEIFSEETMERVSI
jgi:amino acid adenylation domain-containing protein